MDKKYENVEEIIARAREIETEMEQTNADIDALTTEAKELAIRKAEMIAERTAAEQAILAGAGETKESHQENKNMEENKITRNSPEYEEAYGEYLRTGDENIARTVLMSENATDGTVAVPTIVEDAIDKAWSEDAILNMVKVTNYKGNLEKNFVISSTGAQVHTEGGDPITDETLSLGIRTLVPMAIKKNLPVTRQALKLRGREFLNFLQEEVYDHIVIKAGEQLIADILAAPTTATATMPAVAEIEAASVTVSEIFGAEALLSAQAKNRVILMHPATIAAVKLAALSAQYAYDPFDGMKVIPCDSLASVTTAQVGDCLAIIGDFKWGAQANFPDGKAPEIIIDKITNKKSNIVDIFGELYMSIGVVNSDAFARVVVPDSN